MIYKQKGKNMQTTDRLVRLYSVTDPTEAELIKNLLKRNGVECAIDGENQAGFGGVFRIGITVWEKDFDRARKVLVRNGTIQ